MCVCVCVCVSTHVRSGIASGMAGKDDSCLCSHFKKRCEVDNAWRNCRREEGRGGERVGWREGGREGGGRVLT